MNIMVVQGSPIGIDNINFELTKEEKNFILKLNYRKDAVKGPLLSNDISILKNKKLKRIEKILFNYAEEYKNKILQIDNQLRLVHSWATINDNTSHEFHTHKNSFISCCFYVESEGNNKIFFQTGKTVLEKCYFFDYAIKEFNSFNSPKLIVDTKKGDIIMFLSDLAHKSINEGKKIMVGANYFLSGEIGSKKSVSYIKI